MCGIHSARMSWEQKPVSDVQGYKGPRELGKAQLGVSGKLVEGMQVRVVSPNPYLPFIKGGNFTAFICLIRW